jgi:hypothetical protein
MLNLKAGSMAAFDSLMMKCRKPIIHFMFCITHNEAVAENSRKRSSSGFIVRVRLTVPKPD